MSNKNPGQEWISIKEAAEYLGVNAWTIRRMIDSGELPAKRFSQRVIRVRRKDIDTAGKPVESLGQEN